MPENAKIRLVCDPACLLAECPLWNSVEEKLYFTDIEGYCLWRCKPVSGEVEKFHMNERKVGGFAFTRDGDVILCAGNKVERLGRDGRLETLFVFEFPEGDRFNDITTDPEGRIFAGTMSSGLYRLEKGRAPELLLSRVKCSNGMAFSPDQKLFYHVSTGDYTINRYDNDRATGGIENPECFLKFDPGSGKPDGMTIDRDGCLWVALWHGGAACRVSPNGEIMQRVPLPVKIPTSVVFGGAELRDLFITTSSRGRIGASERTDTEGRFLGGGIYCFTVEVGGNPEWPAEL